MLYENSQGNVVLVVDDSPSTVGMLNSALETAGMTTLVALEGNQALKIASKMIPDIILLDAVMPDLDGFEVCAQMKADPELRSIPIIFMTGLKDTESVVKGFQAGGADYITKPINQEELLARIRVHLANSQLVLSAQTALDMAGQNMFATDTTGKVLWTTPQVQQILNLEFSNDAGKRKFSLFMSEWLETSPLNGMSLKIPNSSLKIVLLGDTHNEECLFRLINNREPEEVLVLQNIHQLTKREAEVLFWIAKGKTNREIGQIIETSPRTVNKHLEQIFKKLEVDNRTLAAATALSTLHS